MQTQYSFQPDFRPAPIPVNGCINYARHREQLETIDDTSDFHVECIDLLGNKVEGELGVAFLVACYSCIRKASPLAGLLVMGDTSIQGNIKPTGIYPFPGSPVNFTWNADSASTATVREQRDQTESWGTVLSR